MAIIGNTDVDATRRALVASVVQETLKQKSLLLGTVTDYSQFAVKGAKSVDVPRRAQFAAADKVEDTDLTGQAMIFAADTISLAKQKAIYAEIEKIANVQSNVNVQAEVLKEMAAELALQIDKDIYTELKLASAAAPDHRVAFAGSTLAQEDILGARKLLNIQSVPMDNRYLLITPTHEAEMLAIADFVRADAYGNASGLQNGELGRIYGFTVIMSNVAQDLNCVAYHKSAVGFATQMMPTFETMSNLKGVKDEFLLWDLYGCKVLDSGKRQVLLGSAT